MTVELVSRPAIGPMVDPFARHVTYLRVSVTDRCDFRCVYCMSEHMTFLPKKDLLTLEELDRLCTAFIAKGVRKLRITGGEPLVRKNILWPVSRPVAPSGQRRSRRADADDQRQPTAALCSGAEDSGRSPHQHLARHAEGRPLQGHHALGRLLPGHGRHRGRGDAVGLKIKLNAVALKGVNEGRDDDLIRFAHGRGIDLTLIETMPMGEIDGDRTDQYLPLSIVRARLMDR